MVVSNWISGMVPLLLIPLLVGWFVWRRSTIPRRDRTTRDRVRIRLGWPWRPQLTVGQISQSIGAEPDGVQAVLRELVADGWVHEVVGTGDQAQYGRPKGGDRLALVAVCAVTRPVMLIAMLVGAFAVLASVPMIIVGASAVLTGELRGLWLLALGGAVQWIYWRYFA